MAMFTECCQCTRPEREISVVAADENEDEDKGQYEVQAFEAAESEPQKEAEVVTPIKFKTMPGQTIGVRSQPAFFSPRTGDGVHGEFDVIEITKGDKGQRYLKLADESGWLFTKSLDGEVIAREVELSLADIDLDVAPGVLLTLGVPDGEQKHITVSSRPLGLVYNIPPKTPEFEITTAEGHAKEVGILAGWKLLGVGDVELTKAEDVPAAEKLLSALPVEVVLAAKGAEAKTVLVSRRPLGMEFDRKKPSTVSVVSLGGHAAELGISVGMVVSRIGAVPVKKPIDMEKALKEGFAGLPFQDAAATFSTDGLPLVLLSADGKEEKTVFLQTSPIPFSIAKSAPFTVGKVQPSAKALGVINGQCVKRIGNIEVASAEDVDRGMALVAKLDDSSPPPPKGCCVLM